MTKQIEDYTEDELTAKIEAIKAERERTANALKKYEEELKRREKEVPIGVPIDIKVLLPLLKKGWVAMDKNGDWYWFKNKPYTDSQEMCWRLNSIEICQIRVCNLKPADNWEDSLMECGL